MSAEGPTLRRRRLGTELRRLREAAGLTQEAVSRGFEWHPAKVSRIENGRVAVTPRDVRDLLSLYGVRDDALVALARSNRDRDADRWAPYRDLMRADSFIELEAEASAMRTWEPTVVPGLLQTEAYHRALAALGERPELEREVELRAERQRRLTDDHPLVLTALVDESVIHRVIGGPRVMAGQLRHLLVMTRVPTVSLRVLPFRAGEHPMLGLPVTVLEFGRSTDLDVVYEDRRYRRQPAEVDRHRAEFGRLSGRCLDPGETAALIEKAISDVAAG